MPLSEHFVYLLHMARNTMKKKFSLKDHLFNPESVTYLAKQLASAHADFNSKLFVADVLKRLPQLELKERIIWIAEVLESHLPANYKKACAVIVKALPPPLDPNKTDDDFGSFIFAPFGEYVVRNGCSKEKLEVSYETLLELTLRFSMEDAMRPFLNAFPLETLAQYKKWVRHTNYHARRLVSESTRPLLPWSRRITLPIETPIAFLDILHSDKTRYVTRSVANHLNDISKINPTLTIDTLKRWHELKKQDSDELMWMTRHALRTLVKKGDSGALHLLGYGHIPNISIGGFTLASPTKKILQSDILTFQFDITAYANTELLIDYIIEFVKANGQRKPKVFKIKKVSLRKGESVTLFKKHRLVADATTFVLNPGTHSLTLQINGKAFGSQDFFIH
jgi:3-methyladenine DNA glycosylase AlkC